MTIASPDPVKAAEEFKWLTKTGDELLVLLKGELEGAGAGDSVPESIFYSFGMTDDMKEAIANGSSQLRIGTAIMGSRVKDPKPSEDVPSSAI